MNAMLAKFIGALFSDLTSLEIELTLAQEAMERGDFTRARKLIDGARAITERAQQREAADFLEVA